ncbi:hypothetical protein LINGRAHAP2_LOCUS4138, partial [Linum grandiflorum]
RGLIRGRYSQYRHRAESPFNIACVSPYPARPEFKTGINRFDRLGRPFFGFSRTNQFMGLDGRIWPTHFSFCVRY